MKIRYFAGVGVVLALLVCFLVDRNVVSGDTFSTGAMTNTIPGNLTVTGSANFNTTISLTNDVVFARDAANTAAIRNGGTAGSHVPNGLNLYNFYQDASNYERTGLIWAGDTFYILGEKAGTGSFRSMGIRAGGDLNLGAGNNFYWYLYGVGGNLLPVGDNTTDIGYSSSANRVRTIYVGTSILLGTNVLSFSGTNLTWNGVAIAVP